MKRTILILLAIALLTGIYFLEGRPAFTQNARTLSVYDTALLILKDFVVKGGDTRLGFSNEADFEGAWLDTADGLKVLYLRHDTMTTSMTRMDSELVSLDRMIYPVFTTVGGVTKLRSAITFDVSGGWHPIIFEDSSILAHYIANRDVIYAKDSTLEAAIVMMPQIENHAIITRGREGTKILAHESLRESLDIDVPDTAPADSLSSTPISAVEFMNALTNRLLQAYHTYRDRR